MNLKKKYLFKTKTESIKEDKSEHLEDENN